MHVFIPVQNSPFQVWRLGGAEGNIFLGDISLQKLFLMMKFFFNLIQSMQNKEKSIFSELFEDLKKHLLLFVVQ